MANYFYDANLVRYDLVATRGGKPCNWLFFPGGPGADSRYFHSLVDLLDLPGNIWFIDLPGNGDNVKGIAADYDFDNWLTIFLPTIQKFENPIIVGHSAGSMFPLCFPELEKKLKGFVILNSAPCLWLEEAVAYGKQFNLPDLTKEMQDFTLSPNLSTFRVALDACLPYYFPPKSLQQGRELIADVPFEFLPAVWWQRKVIEMPFSAKWIPQEVPTLIVGGRYDCICPYTLFQQDTRFRRPNIEMLLVNDGGHFPWIENPELVQSAFEKFCKKL